MWQGITPIPDSGFMRKLKVFDPNLDCEFNRHVERFIITQPSRLGSGKLVAAVVENPGKDHYRQPDDRDLAHLAKGDFERKSHKRRIQEGEQYMLEYEEEQDKKVEEDIRNRTKDDKLQLMHTYQHAAGFRADAHNPAFARVNPRIKGKRIQRDGYSVVERRTVK